MSLAGQTRRHGTAVARAGALLLLGLALLFQTFTPSARAAEEHDDVRTDRIVVRFESPDALAQVEHLASELGLIVHGTLPQLNAALLQPTPVVTDEMGNVLPNGLEVRPVNPTKAAAQLRNLPGVLSVEFDTVENLAVIPNDPDYGLQWWPQAVALPAAWDISTGSSSVIVAILDTGLLDIPDFTGRIVSPYSVRYQSSSYAMWKDIVGHGTGTGGMAVAKGNNAKNMAGTAWNVKIMPVHLSDSGSFTTWDTAVGMVWAVDHGAHVINFSAGGRYAASIERDACTYAYNHGVTVVAAVGNDGAGYGINYPAAFPTVIAVGATNSSGGRAWFSNTGSELDLVAPGQDVWTYNLSHSYYWTEARSGTSFSAPIVTGVVALMLSRNPSLSPDRVRSILSLTADDLGQPGWDSYFGDGRLDAAEAVAAAGDRTAPSATFLAPPQGATVSGDCPISFKVSDNLSAKRVAVYLDGVPQLTFVERSPRTWDERTGGQLITTSLTGTFEVVYHTQGVANGSTHTIEVRAYDAAGNTGTQQLRLIVDNRPTTTTTTQPTTTTTVPTTTTTTAPTTTTTRPGPTTTTTTAPGAGFVDVSNSHPYYEAIQFMWNTGIIGGYELGNGLREFRPYEAVLRAQFAKMIDGSVGLRAEEGMTSPFVDLGPNDPASLYPHEYVAVAYANNIVAGLSPTLFGPWQNVSRAQIISMMVRAACTLHPGQLVTPPPGYIGTLGDFSPIHAENARIAEYNGLLAGLVGFGSAWNPWESATRGEVAQMLLNLIRRLWRE